MGAVESYIYYPPELEKSILQENESQYYISDIHVIHLKYPNDKYVIYSHGNASDNNMNLRLGRTLRDSMKMNIILYDYPGYGFSRNVNSSLSRGTPDEESCCRSLKILVDHFKENVCPEKNIVLIGQSLGTGVVVDYISKYLWTEDVVLISPFTSILDVAKQTMWGASFVQGFVDYFNNADKIGKACCRVKIYHGTRDVVIPSSHSKTLAKKLVRTCPVTYINGAGHNDIIHYIDFSTLLS